MATMESELRRHQRSRVGDSRGRAIPGQGTRRARIAAEKFWPLAPGLIAGVACLAHLVHCGPSNFRNHLSVQKERKSLTQVRREIGERRG